MKCFLGAHGTGKTTLCQEIRKMKPNYFVTDAFSRPIKLASFKLQKEGIELDSFQQQILNFELMFWAQQNYYNYNFVLTTRSLFDSLIFSRLLTPELDTSVLEDEIILNKNKIKKIFYLPIEFPLESDGIRFDSKLQRRYDEEIKNIAREFTLNLIHVSGSVQRRLQTIIPHL